jgi:hypothetical protein
MVNLHGALIRTSRRLVCDAELTILVFPANHPSTAAIGRVVYVDPHDPFTVGFELHYPGNVWGVPAPPQDWN